MVEVKDNFLDKDYFKEIQKQILKDPFPWYYNSYITSESDSEDKFYFTHNIFNDLSKNYDYGVSSSCFPLFKDFLIKIKCKSIMRIKANLHLNQNKKRIHKPHKDYSFSHQGCLLYLNDNNGLTYFGKKSVKPKANRVVFFDPSKKHSSSLCTDATRRVNINFNYF